MANSTMEINEEITFTNDELIEALQQARSSLSDDPNFFTAPQLSDELGIPVKEIRRRFKALIKEGKLRPQRRMIENYLGGNTSVMGVCWVGESAS